MKKNRVKLSGDTVSPFPRFTFFPLPEFHFKLYSDDDLNLPMKTKPQPSLEEYLNEVGKLSFNRLKLLKDVITTIYRLRAQPSNRKYLHIFDLLLAWLRVAYTLHPADFSGLASHICSEILLGRKIHPAIIASLRNFSKLPPIALQKLVAGEERRVAKGIYDSFITPDAIGKFEAMHAQLRANPNVNPAWNDLRERHPAFCEKPVLRRRMSMERNFRCHDFNFKNTRKMRAKLEFDSYTYDHNLYGQEGAEALLQKLTVNVTPNGIMIFIPRYWSLDYKRDINWKAIIRILKAWGVPRRGSKRTFGEMEMQERDYLLYTLERKGRKAGMRGMELQRWVESEAKVNAMDRSNFHRSLLRGKSVSIKMARRKTKTAKGGTF